MKYTLTDNPLKTSIAWNLSLPFGFFNLWFFGIIAEYFIKAHNIEETGIAWLLPFGCISMAIIYLSPILLLEIIFKWKLRFKFFTSFVPYNYVFYPAVISNILMGLIMFYALFPY